MTVFHVDRFRQQIINAATLYGGAIFWNDILALDVYPENLWRGMLYIGCARIPGFGPQIFSKLNHPDSRVRAYACFALGQLGERRALERVDQLTFDPSPRVRVHARFAHQVLTGDQFASEGSNEEKVIRKERVLLSEDSGVAQNQIIEGLSGMEVDIELASTMEETIEKAYQWKPSLIITDNQKWGDNTSGLRMISEICCTPELQDILLFMLTADPIEAAVLWHGGDLHFLKTQHALAAIGYHIASYLRGPVKQIIFKPGPPDPSRMN